MQVIVSKATSENVESLKIIELHQKLKRMAMRVGKGWVLSLLWKFGECLPDERMDSIAVSKY